MFSQPGNIEQVAKPHLVNAFSISFHIFVHIASFQTDDTSGSFSSVGCIHHDQSIVIGQFVCQAKAERSPVQKPYVLKTGISLLQSVDHMDAYTFIGKQYVADTKNQCGRAVQREFPGAIGSITFIFRVLINSVKFRDLEYDISVYH